MKEQRSVRYLFVSLTVATILGCQSKESKKEPALNSVDLLRGEVTLCGSQLGKVNFAIPSNAESQKTFNLGMALLHSFEYEEAEKAFVKTIDTDPNCVMAYWGVAMSNYHSLWLQSGSKHLEKGSRVLEIAQSLPKSDIEQSYLDAIQVFYKDYDSLDIDKRKLLYEAKMEELHNKYPDDKEAAIFYALALDAAADPADKTYTKQKKAGEILESLFPGQPDHPGIAHYIIHTYDYPELAARALPTARRYAQIAPASAHAQHMPSHIFIRLGLWDESILSNIHSTTSAVCYGQTIDSTGHWDEELHGMDYLVYAYLQTGANAKAKEQLEYLKSFKKVFPVTFKVAYATAAIPSRIAVENKNWSEAAKLELPTGFIDWNKFPWEQSLFHFTKAIGAVRSGDIESSRKELATLESLHEKLTTLGEKYKANQVKIEINSVQAWIDFASGKKKEALSLMEEAADMEYRTTKHAVTPGEVLPAVELLGDMRMAMNDPAKALEAYELDLQQRPNKFNALYGAAMAARKVDNDKKATEYFDQLLSQSKDHISERKEIAEAKKFVESAGK